MISRSLATCREDLTLAKLAGGADIRGADLSEATITHTSTVGVFIDDTTVWPEESEAPRPPKLTPEG